MANERIPETVCIKYALYQRFDFLRKIADSHKCVPPPDDSGCNFLAKRGDPQEDGVIEIGCLGYGSKARTLLTEEGDLYFEVDDATRKQFYLDRSKVNPTQKVDPAAARSLFILLFGGVEFTEKVRKELCKKPADCPAPKPVGE